MGRPKSVFNPNQGSDGGRPGSTSPNEGIDHSQYSGPGSSGAGAARSAKKGHRPSPHDGSVQHTGSSGRRSGQAAARSKPRRSSSSGSRQSSSGSSSGSGHRTRPSGQRSVSEYRSSPEFKRAAAALSRAEESRRTYGQRLAEARRRSSAQKTARAEAQRRERAHAAAVRRREEAEFAEEVERTRIHHGETRVSESRAPSQVSTQLGRPRPEPIRHKESRPAKHQYQRSDWYERENPQPVRHDPTPQNIPEPQPRAVQYESEPEPIRQQAPSPVSEARQPRTVSETPTGPWKTKKERYSGWYLPLAFGGNIFGLGSNKTVDRKSTGGMFGGLFGRKKST